MSRAVSIWHSITENWGIRNSVVLIFAATPACVAMAIYISTDWLATYSCGSGVGIQPRIDFDPRCSDDLGVGFIIFLAVLCLALAFCYWFIGSIASAVLLAIRRDAGRAAFAGMAIGSGVATVTLLLASVASYFVIDWERLSWERKLIFSGANSPEAAERLVRMATDAGADINAKDNDGVTPLHVASEFLLKALLNAGADVHAEDNWGRTPLHYVAVGRGTVLLEALLNAGADVNTEDNDGVTPLYLAVENGESETVRLLLNAGADVNAKTSDGVTPLYVAVGGTRHVAAGKEKLEMIRLLLNAGADINAKTSDGRTPFHVAVGSEELEMTQLLLNAGADVNAKTSDGRTPLHLVARGRAGLEMTRLLLNAGADVNAKNGDGNTPLHLVTIYQKPDMLEMLLRAGADINVRNNDGDTPLDLTIREPGTTDTELRRRVIEVRRLLQEASGP